MTAGNEALQVLPAVGQSGADMAGHGIEKKILPGPEVPPNGYTSGLTYYNSVLEDTKDILAME